MYDGYTEEAFLQATFREFLILWNSGAQASINIQCEERKAWVQMISSLGSPKSPHSPRYAVPRQRPHAASASHHNSHGPPVYTHHDAHHDCDQSRNGPRQHSSYHGHAHPHPRRKCPRQLERDRTRAAAHRRRLDSLPAVHPQPDNLPSAAAPLPQVDQVALPRAGHPGDDLPPKAGDPADPLQAGHPPLQLRSDFLRPESDSESEVSARLSAVQEHVSPPPLLPSYPLHTRSPPPVQQQPTQQYGANLGSFCFLSSEPSPYPPPSSSRRVPSPRLDPRESLSEIRKPVKHLKGLLSQNIERAVMNSRGGRGGWVWEICVKRDFEDNMVFDSTSFHGFSYSEEYVEENNTYVLGDILEELD